MIKIKKASDIGPNGIFFYPSNEISEEQKENVIARWGDENDYWYFEKGDERLQEWEDYQDYLNRPIELEEEKKIDASKVDFQKLSEDQISALKVQLGIGE